MVNGDFVDATGDGTFKISVPDLAGKKLDHQKLLKRFPLNPVFDGARRETAPGTTGMLVNGTEISNYKSGDVIFFGGVESIDVCLLYTSPSPRDMRRSRMPSSA